MTNFEKVGEFRRTMSLPISDKPQLLSGNDRSYFARFILEELGEYLRACEEESLVDAADGIIDLVYVTMGCAHAMGLPFDKLFDVVHKANMAKVPPNAYRKSLRGSQYDVVKPVGWIPPEEEMSHILRDAQDNVL